MESMDDWMVNEEVTPTMYEMMNHGFNFTNHYSPGYVTGETANTEFVANTGMYPSINKLSPNYAYIDNDYPYSIANLFKKEGYKSVIIRCLKENTANEFYQKIGGKVVELEHSSVHGIDITECVYEFILGDKYS